MNKNLILLLIAVLLSGLFLSPVRSAHAQSCDYFWDFEDGQTSVFTGSGASVVDGQLITAGAVVTLAEIQGLYGINDPIPADNITIGFFVPSPSGSANIQFRYTDGSFENTSNGIPSNNAGKFFNGFIVLVTSGAFEDINLYMPCANVPNYIPPTAEPTVMIESVPGPLPLEPIDETIDLTPFWDIPTIELMVSVIITFFYLENIPQFFEIFLFGMGMIIGLRMIVSIIRRRTKSGEPEI